MARDPSPRTAGGPEPSRRKPETAGVRARAELPALRLARGRAGPEIQAGLGIRPSERSCCAAWVTVGPRDGGEGGGAAGAPMMDRDPGSLPIHPSCKHLVWFYLAPSLSLFIQMYNRCLKRLNPYVCI
jgi:hypothetical protein